MKKRRQGQVKFPSPGQCTIGEPFLLCPAERVIRLYNQATKNKAQRVAKKMREWFQTEAKKEEWGAAIFIKQVQSKFGAGCILTVAQSTRSQMVETVEKLFEVIDEDL